MVVLATRPLGLHNCRGARSWRKERPDLTDRPPLPLYTPRSAGHGFRARARHCCCHLPAVELVRGRATRLHLPGHELPGDRWSPAPSMTYMQAGRRERWPRTAWRQGHEELLPGLEQFFFYVCIGVFFLIIMYWYFFICLHWEFFIFMYWVFYIFMYWDFFLYLFIGIFYLCIRIF